MSALTIATNQGENTLYFYARVDLSEEEKVYTILVKGKDNELSTIQRCWMAVMTFFSIFSKTRYITDETEIRTSITNSIDYLRTQRTNLDALQKKDRKKAIKQIQENNQYYRLRLETKSLTMNQYQEFRRGAPYADHFSYGWGKFYNKRHGNDNSLDNDGLD